MRNTSIFSVDDLWKSYAETDAVRGLTFQISRGEFFGLLGPNGAGKTTTIGLLSGLIEPTRGHISIDGFDLFSRPMEAKAKLGLVPQSFALYPTLCARDNLVFFGRIYGLKGKRLRERTARVLEIVELTDRANQTVATFSHGMKRRLNIAAGLLHEPEILILDEPTVGVDPQSRNAILESLDSLNESGVTVLYTTHYIEEAQRLCDRVAIMDQGKIMALDSPSRLIRDLGRGMIRMEFNAGIDDGLMDQLGRIGSVRVIDGQKKRIHVETDRIDEASRELLELMKKRDGLLKTLDISEPNLETVFIHLTGRNLRD
ncbi:MAG TPA: ABC transporter ATP-binding protein [Thermodesulfobacteriota bacterium]|nr:ABC transporter ATP-binding protein [Thermodesulfobacteriota bacterium]